MKGITVKKIAVGVDLRPSVRKIAMKFSAQTPTRFLFSVNPLINLTQALYVMAITARGSNSWIYSPRAWVAKFTQKLTSLLFFFKTFRVFFVNLLDGRRKSI